MTTNGVSAMGASTAKMPIMQSDDALDAIAAAAAQGAGLPIGLVTFLTPDEQIFVGRYGYGDRTGTPIDHAFCKLTVQDTVPLVIPDTHQDHRFKNNPLVTAPPCIRFYAGVPIVLDDGRRCGSVCVLGDCPQHEKIDALLALLKHMARAASRIISDRIHTDAARRLAQARQQEAEDASQAKSVFIATMSHELRTPLNAVIGFTEILDTELFGSLGDPRYKDYTGHILESSRHLLGLIEDILALSKIDADEADLDLEDIDLADEIRWCLHLLWTKSAGRGVKLVNHADDMSLRIRADRQRCRQVLLNIVGNAVKYTPSGGTVTLSGIENSARPGLVVSDTGIGIDAETLNAIGEPFLRAPSAEKSATPGSGLGLALAKRLVERMAGGLEIASAVGDGTTVTLTWQPMGQPAPGA